MNEPAPLELIHAEIDGELEAQQRAALSRTLLADPDTRALRQGLRRVCTALDRLEAVEPPPQLRSSILAALPAIVRPVSARRAAGWSAPAAGWRYAALVVGALVAGAVLYKAGIDRAPDVHELAGTMAAPGARSTVMLDTVRVELAQLTGQVSLYRTATGLDLELQLSANAPVDVLISSGGQTRRIGGLGRSDSRGGPRAAIELPEPWPGAQTVDLTFLVEGRPIGAAHLRVPAGG